MSWVTVFKIFIKKYSKEKIINIITAFVKPDVRNKLARARLDPVKCIKGASHRWAIHLLFIDWVASHSVKVDSICTYDLLLLYHFRMKELSVKRRKKSYSEHLSYLPLTWS